MDPSILLTPIMRNAIADAWGPPADLRRGEKGFKPFSCLAAIDCRTETFSQQVTREK